MNPSVHTCPRCGLRFPMDVAEGLCPRCLVENLLAPPTSQSIGEQPGDRIGPYRLIRLMGEGGMGRVWQARQEEAVERVVALKIIRLGMDTGEFVARFEREMRTLAQMDHPAVARILDAGATDSGRPYFVMERVQGEPVHDFCRTHRLALEQRLNLFIRICDAVEHAHRKGIIHRDLKPANILVTDGPDGPSPKIIDFGIARILEPDPGTHTLATRIDQALGTPGYMSPEQAGAAPDLDTRTDVYSLGALLYELLTEAPPFTPDSFRRAAAEEVMRIIRETDPPRPSTRATDSRTRRDTPPPSRPIRIAADLDRIVMKALARERERRYGSAEAFREDVRRFLDHEPVVAADPTLVYRASRFVRRHRWPVALATTVAAALIVGFVVARREAGRARQAAEAESKSRLETLATLADSYRDTGLAKSRQQEHAAAALWFTLAAETAPHDESRQRANRLRARLHTAEAPVPVRFLARRQGPGGQLVFDDRSRYLMESAAGASPIVFDLESGRPVEFGVPLACAAFLPGASLVALSRGDDSLEIRDPRDGARMRGFTIPGERVSFVHPSDDGHLLLAGGSSPRVIDIGSGRFLTPPLPHDQPVRFAAFSVDAGRLVTIDRGNALRVFRVEPGRDRPIFEPIQVDDDAGYHGDPYLRRLWESDGKLLVKIDNGIREVDALTGKILGLRPELRLGFNTDLSATGAWLATPSGVRRTGEPEFLFKSNAGDLRFLPDESGVFATAAGEFLDLQGERTRVTPPGPGHQQAFSPDGTLLAIREATGIRIHRLAVSEPFLRISEPNAGLIAVSPDDTLFVSAGSEQRGAIPTTTRAFRLKDGLAAGPSIETGLEIRSAVFLPDSQRLLTGGRETAHDAQPDPVTGGRGLLQVWDVRSAERLAGPLVLPSEPMVLRCHPSAGWIVALCKDGSILRTDPSLRGYEVLQARETGPTPSEEALRAGLLFSPDGATLYANGPGNRTRAIDATTGRFRFPPVPQRGSSVRLQLQDDLILSLTEDSSDPWLIDARTGTPHEIRARFRQPLPTRGSSLGPDGKELLAVGRDWVSILDWRRGEERGPGFESGQDAWGFSRFIPGTSWVLSAIAPDLEPPTLHLWDSRTGAALAPPWRLRGERRFADMQITPDGTHAILSITGQGFVVVKLDELRELAASPPRLPPQERLVLAALHAGLRLDRGRPTRFAPPFEWASAWEAFNADQPCHDPLKPSRDALIRWHRNQEALHGPDSAPGRWHRARVGELERD